MTQKYKVTRFQHKHIRYPFHPRPATPQQAVLEAILDAQGTLSALYRNSMNGSPPSSLLRLHATLRRHTEIRFFMNILLKESIDFLSFCTFLHQTAGSECMLWCEGEWNKDMILFREIDVILSYYFFMCEECVSVKAGSSLKEVHFIQACRDWKSHLKTNMSCGFQYDRCTFFYLKLRLGIFL